VAEHVLKGTYRADRHGPLPENVLPMPTLESASGQGGDEGWRPSRADLRALGRAGKTFVSTWVQVHVMNLREGVVLLAAARCRDNADRWHRKARAKGPMQARFSRLALGYEKQFASLLAQLKVQS
jgi:hypothetical protein